MYKEPLLSVIFQELCDFRQENCFEDADDVDKDIAIKLNDCKMKGQLTIGQQKLSLQLRKVAGVEDNLHQAFDCENESRAVTSQEFDCLKAADVDGYWKFQSGLSVKPFCTVQQNCQQISLSPDESYEAFTTCDGRLISSCQNYVAEQLNNGGREDMGSSSIGCTAKEEATIPKHKKDSESDLDRFRRNTTDGILPEMTNNEMKSHRRCSSDRKESHEIMGFPEHHYRNSLQQQQTWNSFQNNWKDACLAESEDDQLCSDLEPDHDDVFIEHFREENEFSVDSSNSLDHISEVKEE